jgi:hypothetical protein
MVERFVMANAQSFSFSAVRVGDAFVDELHLAALGSLASFRLRQGGRLSSGSAAEALAVRYLNQVQSSRGSNRPIAVTSRRGWRSRSVAEWLSMSLLRAST